MFVKHRVGLDSLAVLVRKRCRNGSCRNDSCKKVITRRLSCEASTPELRLKLEMLHGEIANFSDIKTHFECKVFAPYSNHLTEPVDIFFRRCVTDILKSAGTNKIKT